MRVKEVMSTEPVTAYEQDGLRQTFYRMRDHGIRHMPVLDDQESLVGIISDRDLRRPDWVDDEENVAHYYLLDNTRKVGETMTPEPQTMGPDDDVMAANKIFVQHRFGAIPVVDADRKLVGILSAHDLLRAFGQMLSEEG